MGGHPLAAAGEAEVLLGRGFHAHAQDINLELTRDIRAHLLAVRCEFRCLRQNRRVNVDDIVPRGGEVQLSQHFFPPQQL